MSKTADLMLELARLGEILKAAEILHKHEVMPGNVSPKDICKSYVEKTPILTEHIANRAAQEIFNKEMQGSSQLKPTGFMRNEHSRNRK